MIGGMQDVPKATRRQKITLAGPGFEGRFEVGERTVGDPLEPGAVVKAAANVRESAISHMASRGRINTAQEAAGERFRRLYEQAAIGRARGVDPEKEYVDGGTIGDPLTDDLVRAVHELNRAMGALGMVHSRVLQLVLEKGSIEAAATAWSKMGGVVTGRRAEGYVSGTLVDALDALVSHWKLEGIGRAAATKAHYLRAGAKVPVHDDIVSSGPISFTGPARQISVGRLGDVVVEEIRPVDRGPMMVHTSGNASGYGPSRKKSPLPRG